MHIAAWQILSWWVQSNKSLVKLSSCTKSDYFGLCVCSGPLCSRRSLVYLSCQKMTASQTTSTSSTLKTHQAIRQHFHSWPLLARRSTTRLETLSGIQRSCWLSHSTSFLLPVREGYVDTGRKYLATRAKTNVLKIVIGVLFGLKDMLRLLPVWIARRSAADIATLQKTIDSSLSCWCRFHRCWAPVWMQKPSSSCRATYKQPPCSWFETDVMLFT